jgi:predicted dehydrogenase
MALNAGSVDAVIVATPRHLHAPMSIAALERRTHVLSKVLAAVNMQEAERLALSADLAIYAMAENYLFTRENRMIRAFASAGLFGTPSYGRGEYLHELKELNERTPWRRTWQTGIRVATGYQARALRAH